jgi:hypothetical protein
VKDRTDDPVIQIVRLTPPVSFQGVGERIMNLLMSEFLFVP